MVLRDVNNDDARVHYLGETKVEEVAETKI